MWLYDNILSKQENSLSFLEYFGDTDDRIRKEIDHINKRNSKTTKSI
jgi:hypothetical protein